MDNEIALVRKIIKSQSYFITVSKDLIPEEWKKVAITIVPLNTKWGSKKITFIKKIGESKLYNSAKIVIPKFIIEYLNADEGEYAWFRIMKGNNIEDEPKLPSTPYIADIRGVHGYLSSYFILISKTYLDKIINVNGRDKWSGKLYLALKVDSDVVRLITKPKEYHGYKMYHIILPHEDIDFILEKTQLKGKSAYVAVVPLPKGYNEKILVNPPSDFPL